MGNSIFITKVQRQKDILMMKNEHSISNPPQRKFPTSNEINSYCLLSILRHWTFRVRYWIFMPFELRAKPASANNGGYTLLEMVIAVGIFTMVMLTASMGMVMIQKTWSSITLQNQKTRSLQVIDSVVDSAFRNAVPFAWTDENLKNSIVFLGDGDRIILAYRHRINNVDEGGIRFISLFLDKGCLVAAYRKTPMLPWDGKTNTANTDREILAEKVRSISFLYADRKKDNISWLSAWDKTSPNIPLAIQVKVEWMDGDSEVWMRRTAGAGLRETYGVRVEQ